jgi:hypothetical protein
VNSLSPAKGIRHNGAMTTTGRQRQRGRSIDWSKADLPEGWERVLDPTTNKVTQFVQQVVHGATICSHLPSYIVSYRFSQCPLLLSYPMHAILQYFYIDHERKRTQWRHPLDSTGGSREWVREDCIKCDLEEGVRYFGIGENVKGFYFGDPKHSDLKSTTSTSRSPQRNRSGSGHLSRSSTPASSPSKPVSNLPSPSTAHKQRGALRGDERKGEHEEKLTESDSEMDHVEVQVERRESERAEGKMGERGRGDKEGKGEFESDGDGDGHRVNEEDEAKDGREEEEIEGGVDPDKK